MWKLNDVGRLLHENRGNKQAILDIAQNFTGEFIQSLNPMVSLMGLWDQATAIWELATSDGRGDPYAQLAGAMVATGFSREMAEDTVHEIFLARLMSDVFNEVPEDHDGDVLLEFEANCFPAETRVHAEHSDVAISQVIVGQRVWAYNYATARKELRQVTEVFQTDAVELIDITTNTGTFSATPEHPFWVIGKGWKPVSEVMIGDQLGVPDGSYSTKITGIQSRRGAFSVYNFEVEGLHNYLVEEGLLVHNRLKFDLLGRASSYFAKITPGNLGTGTKATKAARAWTTKNGLAGDDAGHILASLLGGKGGLKKKNIVPIRVNLNRGKLAALEKAIGQDVAVGKTVFVKVKLDYGSGGGFRPKNITYQVRTNGTTRTFTFAN
ncbi:MAG: hypothetical protein EOP09_13830 [Proteobacteria bacterium]|nr:MAG: hypothetical protein EOP09_13830 [Pseudomonadota bacterium]